jgi:SAM-dependent methyltransferase
MKAELSDVDRAHAAYTRRSLGFYDWWVLGISNRHIWKCETEKILELYRAKLSANHLEVGVGTGYFLEHSLSGMPRIALVDINRDCLDRTARRIAAYKPEVHQENVLEPLHLKGKRFDSIAINYLLHCLPGALEVKAGKVCDHLIPFLENDGVLFGSTILGLDIQRPFFAKLLMGRYNKNGIFSNAQDSLGGIMETLSNRFKTFNVEVCGCVVLFWGKGLRDDYRHAETLD